MRNRREEDRLAAEKQRADVHRATRAESLVQALGTADTAELRRIVAELADLRDLARPKLVELAAQPITTKPGLHARLALLSDEPRHAAEVAAYLPTCDLEELVTIREFLKPHKEAVAPALWAVLSAARSDSGQRVRAAGALAELTPNDARWKQLGGAVATALVNQDSFVIGRWTAALKPVGRWLFPTLADFLVDEGRSPLARGVIARAYATLAADVPDAGFRLETMLTAMSDTATPEERIDWAKRQASIGASLLVLGRVEKAWPLLQHRPDPTMRSYLVERLVPFGVDPRMLMARLAEEKDVTVRRAILLGLGEYGAGRMSSADRERLLAIYRDDPDAGVHGVVEWTLREWGVRAELQKVDRELATGTWSGIGSGISRARG